MAGTGGGLGGWRHGWLALWLAALPAPAGLPPVVDRPADDAILFSLSLDHVSLGESLHGFPSGDGYLLPLGELCRELELGVQVDPVRGSADGFIIEEKRRFHLDLEAGTVSAGTLQPVDPARVERHPDDIYVDTRVLAQWLPLDLKVNFRDLAIQVSAREPLPIEQRWAREDLAPGLLQRHKAPEFELLDQPFALAEVPFLDETLRLGAQPGATGQPSWRIQSSTTATADLLHLSGRFYALADSHGGLQNSWLTLGRQDARAGLLGPLRATRFALGQVLDPGLDLVSVAQSGTGLVLDNVPRHRASSLDFHSFKGSLAQGWQVELYRNRALLGFQASRADGQYEFLNIPLFFGRNDFILVFYGPQGQRREEPLSFNTQESQVPPGVLEYRLAALKAGLSGKRAHGELHYGVSERLEAGAALAQAVLDGQLHTYLVSGVDQFWPLASAGAAAVRDLQGGSALDLNARTSLGWVDLRLKQDSLQGGFQSEVFPAAQGIIRGRSQLDLATNSRFLQGGHGLFLTLGGTRDRLAEGYEETLHAGISVNAGGLGLANDLSRIQGDSGGVQHLQTEGSFLVSHSLGGAGLRAQAGYQLSDGRRLDQLALQGDLPVSRWLRGQVELDLDLLHRQRTLQLGLESTGGPVGLGATLAYSTLTRFSADLTLRLGLSREPRGGALHPTGQSGITETGAISVQVFLDANENGVLDPGETPLEGVSFRVNGAAQPEVTDADGVLYLPGLPANQEVSLSLVLGTLKDPLMRPLRPGVRVIPRSGHVARVPVPVVVHGELTGTVRMRAAGGDQPLAGVKLELVDAGNRVVKSIRSEFDGYFIMSDLLPGDYRLQVPREEAASHKLIAPPAKELRFEASGTSLDGVDLVLEPPPAGSEGE